MESQPQNPEFRNNPENSHPCTYGSNIFGTRKFVQALRVNSSNRFRSILLVQRLMRIVVSKKIFSVKM